MLLDEITSALDPQLVSEVLALVRELAEQRDDDDHRHPRDELRKEVADKVCFLDDGVILEEGPPEQIFTAPERGADPGVPRPHHRGGAAVRRAGSRPKAPLAIAGVPRFAALLLVADVRPARDRPPHRFEWRRGGS